MDFHYDPQKGVKLSVFDINFLNQSSLWIVKPGWTYQYYGAIKNKEIIKNARIEDFEGGKKITLYHSLPSDSECPFEGTETYILKPNHTFSCTVDYHFTSNEEAIIEWNAGGIRAAPILGAPYQVVSPKGKHQGVIPIVPVGSLPQDSMIAESFESLKIDSRIGPIEIKTHPKSGILLFDYRNNVWARADNPIFWMGCLSRSLTQGQQYTDSITFKFPEKPVQTTSQSPAIEAKVKTRKTKSALLPWWGNDYIIPTPKQLEFTGERLPLSSKTKIFIGNSPSPKIQNALNFFLNDVESYFQIKIPVIVDHSLNDFLPPNSLILGEKVFPIDKELKKKVPSHPEAYYLGCENSSFYILANTETGLFYGLCSLLQLIQVDRDGIFLKGAEVIDYPALSFRGVHCLSGKDAGDQIAKAIRTLMARHKMNQLVWECEYIIWDSHPELEHERYGMEKEDARKVVEAADQNFVEIIPLVQSLGHSEWIFTNDQNLDIAEDPDTPYAYCPTNPKTYDFIFEVYQEALDFFKPKKFHIGHDEVTMLGRFPWRSRSSGKSVTELVMDDIKKLHTWFTEKDIEIMMWGDMCLWTTEAPDATFAPSAEEAKLRRSLLPKDVYITDWHYAPRPPLEYPSIPLWNEEGFRTIGAGWFSPENIRNLARACVLAKAEGYLQTTWAGFNFKIDGNEEAWYQYWAYLLAAEYAWSGMDTPVDELPYNVQNLFIDLWTERKPVLKSQKGFFVDLSPVANRSLKDNEERSGWLGFGPDFDFSAFPVGEILEGPIQFKTMPNSEGNTAVLMTGKLNPKGDFPKKISLGISSQKASELHFLMNTGFPAQEGHTAGNILVEYQDGTADTLNLIYGKNLFCITDRRAGIGARTAWEGQSRNGQSIRAWDVVWNNPEPQKKIKRIILESADTEATPILLAITGIR